MTKIIIYLIFLLIITSCHYEVDRTNPFKTADAIHEGLVRNDSTILKNVFEFPMDSSNSNSLYNRELNKAKKFFRKNEQIKIFKTDTSTFIYTKNKIIDIYYKKKKDFYRIRTYYDIDSTNTIKPKSFNFSNINEICEEMKNRPFIPKEMINFKKLIWNTDYNSKTFKDGAVELQNNTDIDLNYIKFRVVLRNGTSTWSAVTFFNQTVVSYSPIYKGDIVKIDVPGMTDYYAGFKIEKDALFFNPELIEVKPRPESSWCKTLEELREEAIKKSN